MAVISKPTDYAVPSVKVGPKTATAALYIVIGIAAMAVAIPAALATGDVGLFEECYSACAAAAQ